VPRVDFAWLAPAEEITSDRALTIPDQGETILVLSNSGANVSSVRVQDLASGETSRVSVPAFGTATLLLTGPSRILQSSEIYATAVILIEGQISDLEFKDPKNLGSEVLVRFR
jgi:hypothetical protein